MSNPMCPVRVREAFSKILEYQKMNSTGECVWLGACIYFTVFV